MSGVLVIMLPYLLCGMSTAGVGLYTQQALITTVGIQVMFLTLAFPYSFLAGWSSDPSVKNRINFIVMTFLVLTCIIGAFFQFKS